MTRTLRIAALLAALALILGAAAGCTQPAQKSEQPAPQPDSSAEPTVPIRIGTLPTEDSLPLWVAEEKGLFEKAGLKVTILSFKSAQERDAALTAHAIDAFMGDIIAATNLRAGGSPVKITTVMLGATPKQGRFGVVAAPGTPAGTPGTGSQLPFFANVPIGTSSATIQEYVLDKLMIGYGVPKDRIKTTEVKAVPVRFELLMQKKLKAAALPEPFLSLAEKQGALLLADDTLEGNLSQTVLVADEAYLGGDGGATMAALLDVWDEAARLVNAEPAAYRATLVDKARLPKPLESDYEVNEYPAAQLPRQAEVDAVLEWMRDKGYLKQQVTYDELVWKAP